MGGWRVLRAADRRAVPWKNGGGLTEEVAAHPQGAGMDAFEWRISIAEVRVDGAFSMFSGVDRVLTILEGRLELALAGDDVRCLDARAAPLAFAGDVAAFGRPLGGTVRDLNVMVRRGVWRARVERCAGQMVELAGPGALCATGAGRVRIDGEDVELARLDVVVVDGGQRVRCERAGVEEMLVVRIEPMTPSGS